MSLYQPTNMYPSAYLGKGNDVIDAGVDNIFSAHLNGSSSIDAYQLICRQNDTSNTIVYNTGIVQLSSAFYGKDYEGNTVPLEILVPSNQEANQAYSPTPLYFMAYGGCCVGEGIVRYKMVSDGNLSLSVDNITIESNHMWDGATDVVDDVEKDYKSPLLSDTGIYPEIVGQYIYLHIGKYVCESTNDGAFRTIHIVYTIGSNTYIHSLYVFRSLPSYPLYGLTYNATNLFISNTSISSDRKVITLEFVFPQIRIDGDYTPEDFNVFDATHPATATRPDNIYIRDNQIILSFNQPIVPYGDVTESNDYLIPIDFEPSSGATIQGLNGENVVDLLSYRYQAYCERRDAAQNVVANNMHNGYANGYKWTLTIWDDYANNPNHYVISPENAFYTRVQPNLTITSPTLTNNYYPSQKALWTASISNGAVQSYRWTLYRSDTMEIVDDTGEVYSSNVGYETDRLLNGITYIAKVTITCVDGTVLEGYSNKIPVLIHTVDSGTYLVTRDVPANNSICVEFNIDGSLTRQAHLVTLSSRVTYGEYREYYWNRNDQVYTLESAMLNATERHNRVVHNALVIRPGSKVVIYNGDSPLNSVVPFYWQGRLMDIVSSYNVLMITMGGQSYALDVARTYTSTTHKQQFVWSLKKANQTIDTITVDGYGDCEDYIFKVGVINDTLYLNCTSSPSSQYTVSETLTPEDNVSVRNVLELGEGQIVDYICVGEPQQPITFRELTPMVHYASWDVPFATEPQTASAFAITFDKSLSLSTLVIDGVNFTQLSVYREDYDSGLSSFIGYLSPQKNIIYDYGVANNHTYSYIGYITSTDNSVTSSLILESAPITTNWSYWTLFSAEDFNNPGVFEVIEQYRFGIDVNSHEMSNNMSTNKLETYTPFPKIQVAQSNHWSGSLTAVLANIDCTTSTIGDEQDMLDRLRWFCTDGKRKWLKDLKGHIWEVVITESLQASYSTDRVGKSSPYKVTIPWCQVAEDSSVCLVSLSRQE